MAVWMALNCLRDGFGGVRPKVENFHLARRVLLGGRREEEGVVVGDVNKLHCVLQFDGVADDLGSVLLESTERALKCAIATGRRRQQGREDIVHVHMDLVDDVAHECSVTVGCTDGAICDYSPTTVLLLRLCGQSMS